MANELNFQGSGGLTLVARIYADNWVQQGGDIVMTEGAAGLYTGTVPLATVPDGEFSVLFVAATVVRGSGVLIWVDDAEVDLEHMNALLESDQVFDFGALTLAYNRRNGGAAIIPLKNVLGQKQDANASLLE